MGFGDWIFEVERGRPFGMSRLRFRSSRRDSRRLLDEECLCLSRDEFLDDDECLSLELLDLDDDLESPYGTSRTFSLRPVVGSTV